MLKRMEKKTGIKITPHMLRHYFGNERRKAGWALELIQIAYGHRHIQTTINYLDIVDTLIRIESQKKIIFSRIERVERFQNLPLMNK